MTCQQYIYQALRKCGNMRPGYTPQPELLADCYTELLSMYDSANAERTLNYSMPDYVFPVTGPGHGSTGNGQQFGGTGYQIGPTALDFVTPFRPVAIVRINLYMTSVSPSSPTRIPLSPISMEEWMGIAVLQIVATNVTTVYAYDPQYPNGVLWLWPPLNGNSLEIFTWGSLAPPLNLAAAMAVPVGYQDAFIWRLAERCWPLCLHDMFLHKLPLQYIAGKAHLAEQKIRAINAPMPRMASDFGGGRSTATGICDWDLLLTGRPY